MAIRFKRDMHPAFRKECISQKIWGKKPENRGRTVVFDKKKRQILVDGKVVDLWKIDLN